MTGDTIEMVGGAARKKADYLKSSPHGYLVMSALAGVYVGFAIVLIFAIGAPFAAASSPATKLVMGASFGVALALVIFAGSELFTGNNLVMIVGLFKGKSTAPELAAVWVLSFAGNLAGSLGLAWLVTQSGVLSADPQLSFIQRTVETKMTLPSSELFFRAILCNWLVCLAVWSAMRTQSEAAKLVMIFWCLFAFIGAGFEHSVANMTLLGIGLFQEHPEAITWGGMAHNLVPVTLGNIVGGAGFVGGAYLLANTSWRLSPGADREAAPAGTSPALVEQAAGSALTPRQ